MRRSQKVVQPWIGLMLSPGRTGSRPGSSFMQDARKRRKIMTVAQPQPYNYKLVEWNIRLLPVSITRAKTHVCNFCCQSHSKSMVF